MDPQTRQSLLLSHQLLKCLGPEYYPEGQIPPDHIHYTEPYATNCLRNISQEMRHINSGAEMTICADDTKFHMYLDLQDFEGEDVNVLLRNGFIIVEAKHEERKFDSCSMSRRLVRRYPLPENVFPGDLEAAFSEDGVLTVKAAVRPPSMAIKIPVKRLEACKQFWRRAPFQGATNHPGMGHGAPPKPPQPAQQQQPKQATQ
ncbi:protein lethal(2)essential for life-like [Anticarsia gemmatalis]|uniref:protein lethal(2)essential for life-like n=1 Tax=Anticarsia gemmatalis TaxID=129554 RepID=UPI003F760DEF